MSGKAPAAGSSLRNPPAQTESLNASHMKYIWLVSGEAVFVPRLRGVEIPGPVLSPRPLRLIPLREPRRKQRRRLRIHRIQIISIRNSSSERSMTSASSESLSTLERLSPFGPHGQSLWCLDGIKLNAYHDTEMCRLCLPSTGTHLACLAHTLLSPTDPDRCRETRLS